MVRHFKVNIQASSIEIYSNKHRKNPKNAFYEDNEMNETYCQWLVRLSKVFSLVVVEVVYSIVAVMAVIVAVVFVGMVVDFVAAAAAVVDYSSTFCALCIFCDVCVSVFFALIYNLALEILRVFFDLDTKQQQHNYNAPLSLNGFYDCFQPLTSRKIHDDTRTNQTK